MNAYHERKYEEIADFIKENHSILLFGPRGSGKTVFLRHVLTELSPKRIINLLDADLYLRYSKDPGRFSAEIQHELEQLSQSTPHYIMVDEVQRLPELLNQVQLLLDEYGSEKLVFILTGSSARKLKREDANLLAGRALAFDFFPFSSNEVDFNRNLDSILQWGTLPRCYLSTSKQFRTAYLNTYTERYLEEEIQRESEIRNLAGFARFLELAAHENGKLTNYSKISKAVSLHPSTVKEYFQILSDTLIATQVPAWSAAIRTQLQKSPKYYFFDNGVLNALTGHLQSELRPQTYRYGSLFENTVVNEIIRKIRRRRHGLKIYHYRDVNQQEIDLVLQKNSFSLPIAIEIKSSGQPELKARHVIRRFAELSGGGKALVIANIDKAFHKAGLDFYPMLQGVEHAIELALR